MYFEIENTPEHIKKLNNVAPKENAEEEYTQLDLAPFTKPPKIVFDNVILGTSCERELIVYNPSDQAQKITLGKSLPPGLVIQLPGEWLEVKPKMHYCLSMTWTPMQPTATREIIPFTNESRRRFEVIVILKSIMNIKGRKKPPKGSKISPGKIKKKVLKKSPVAINKKKAEVIYKTTEIKEIVNIQTSQYNNARVTNKENSVMMQNKLLNSYTNKCPFDSLTSSDINFNMSEVFSNMKQVNLQDTYDKSYMTNVTTPIIHKNILKPSNKQLYDNSPTDLFDNLTFTPLKAEQSKVNKINTISNINVDFDYDVEYNLDIKNKENETHSIISVTNTQHKWLPINPKMQKNSQYIETPTIQYKKHPDTSSPKEFNSPNFSINTEVSRISDLSFVPQKFSTERKCASKINNDTHDLIDDIKISSDTYTKESPYTVVEEYFNKMPEHKPPHFFLREQNPRICRQALFKEQHNQKDNHEHYMMSIDSTARHHKENFNKYLKPSDCNPWENYCKMDPKSPPRSITPPLQSIPEESYQISDPQVNNKTHNCSAATVKIDRTFDKPCEKSSMLSNRSMWSKKIVRAEHDFYKVPLPFVKKTLKVKSSIKSKESLNENISNYTFEGNKSVHQNISINQIGNVYSQSLTVDPFMSSTYYYDEDAVAKFETECKTWLNCILTPPADLDSNIEQKIDVGKVWLENRNKEIPLAPTKEQVSSVYHNSHRLERLRRAARALLMSPDVSQVLQKLYAQIDKKLIAIRSDRNLHLDVGLQKIIMEILLSYNPLWLRIGLEALYRIVIPLKSNSDVEGLSTFIIQRMFRNPYLKNKNSKSNTTNMLLPAYMDAIKKFTLKKFFTLVFFLDQAKQKKIISHDPCLFCRNAMCKESRDIIIKFTRELIAGIGDITKHLRPLGYVVCHKQSYLDEYKYAVHNIAIDIRDGVRLTKVMEIILIKNGLMNQLRTPAISRLQKVHNVQVALSALKEANFTIVGDIIAADIAEGHREKTLSLLWQIIHKFRAPLFEKASNIIQTWWRKKYAVIIEKRMKEEELQHKLNNAASVIQCWWRRIQYNRLVQWEMQRITTATVVIQKWWRMKSSRITFRKVMSSIVIIQRWYRSIKLVKEAKAALHKLRIEREELKQKSVTIIQSYVRRWLCMKRYNRERNQLAEQMKSTVILQSYFRMRKQYRSFQKLKGLVRTIEEHYIALLKMRKERQKYLEFKKYVILIQALCRRKICRTKYLKERFLVIQVQRKVRAKQAMIKQRNNYLKIRNAALVLQKYFKCYLHMKRIRRNYQQLRVSTILIQGYFRAYLLAKAQKKSYNELRQAAIVLQKSYRNLLLMREVRSEFLKMRNSAITVQRRYRAQQIMKKCKINYSNLRKATITIQRKYTTKIQMRKQRAEYLKLKHSCVLIQNAFRAHIIGKKQRQEYLSMKMAAIKIQTWIRNCKKGQKIKHEYEKTKKACVIIQRVCRSYIIAKKQRQEYIRLKTATIRIQQYYRCYIEMKIARQKFVTLKSATITIQRYYRSHLETKKVMDHYSHMKAAASLIANYYRRYKETKNIRQSYLELRNTTKVVQLRFRAILAMKIQRQRYLKLRKSVIYIQQKYRALLAMKKERKYYLNLRSAVMYVQLKYRANVIMKLERAKYVAILKACVTIQRNYRAYVGKQHKEHYLKLKNSVIKVQQRYRALLKMREARTSYLKKRVAAVLIQRQYRGHCQMIKERQMYQKIKKACVTIQRSYRAYTIGKKLRNEYTNMKHAVFVIQTRFRMKLECRRIRNEFLALRMATVFIQRHFRTKQLNRSLQQNTAATKIQRWYISIKKRNECRVNYLKLIKSVTLIQSTFRMYFTRKRYTQIKKAAVSIQQYYRSYKLTTAQRNMYVVKRDSIITLQSYVRAYIYRQRYLRLRSATLLIQSVYRRKRLRDLTRKEREAAAICIQRNVRRYFAESRYAKYRNHVIFVQKIWRGKLLTRLMRCEFLQKKNFIVKFKALIRGFLVRRRMQRERENLIKLCEEQKRARAASIIQALIRGHQVRKAMAHDKRVEEIRRRWRKGALKSIQQTLKERNEDAMDVLRNMCDMETVISAFKSLELLTEVFPMMYTINAPSIVRRVYVYMSVTNRSISGIEVLKSAAAVLVNLTRYKITGPKIYARERISPILKLSWRFSNSETQLFCILATYLWLFAKYDDIKKDLIAFLHEAENHKMLLAIKGNIERMKRMANNAVKNKFHTPQSSRFVSHTANMSLCSVRSRPLLPTLEPDYGIVRPDKPRYFEDAQQAIDCIFLTFKL